LNRESVKLREAVAEDSDFVFDVRRQAFRDYVLRSEGWSDARELELHLERFARQRFRIIAAEGIDAGYIATHLYPQATTERPACLYLHQLMVLPAFQSRGIGLACLRLLRTEAQALRLPVRLRVLRVNPRALQFYVRAGCQIVDESESHISLELAARARPHARRLR
jgi:ribosomal protein S18 acetylase RimI-like enzyme